MLFIPQKRHNECGLASLLMLLNINDFSYKYKELRKISKFYSFYEMSNFLDDNNIEYSMFKYDIYLIVEFPIIGVLNVNSRKHFIVIWKIIDKYIYFSDPANFYIQKKKITKIGPLIMDAFLKIEASKNPKKTKTNFYVPYKVKIVIIIVFISILIYNLLLFFDIIV